MKTIMYIIIGLILISSVFGFNTFNNRQDAIHKFSTDITQYYSDVNYGLKSAIYDSEMICDMTLNEETYCYVIVNTTLKGEFERLTIYVDETYTKEQVQQKVDLMVDKHFKSIIPKPNVKYVINLNLTGEVIFKQIIKPVPEPIEIETYCCMLRWDDPYECPDGLSGGRGTRCYYNDKSNWYYCVDGWKLCE